MWERCRESWMWQNRLLQTMMWKKSIKADGVMGIVVWDFKVFDLSDQLNMGL